MIYLIYDWNDIFSATDVGEGGVTLSGGQQEFWKKVIKEYTKGKIVPLLI